MKTHIEITRQARKGLEKSPKEIRSKFTAWFHAVELMGLAAVRQVPGYHDEPLQGERKGQRSVRLNKQWRAFYTITKQNQIIVTVLEVSPHDYRTK